MRAGSPGLPLHTRILLGLGVGALGGLAANTLMGSDHAGLAWVVRQVAEPVGALFLRLLLMIVVPLVFSSLVVGVAGIGDLRRLGRVGLR
ncbi:MAG: cation:dicarboxylase symporter family transporter, partial [Candidatus Latescibacteria bacterium]|nr:cation:dicarboxylase symporter family transporter [Candidatus Latescibacterota bacterium]